jgi:diguanylate cyclase (GGDEF)-like protein
LPETDEEGAYDALQKIRKKIENTKFAYDNKKISITITMGVCIFQHGDKIDDCINTADSALYEGKMNGKNKVVISYNKMLSLKL